MLFFANQPTGYWEAIIWRALLAGRKFAMLDAASMSGAKKRKLNFTIWSPWSMGRWSIRIPHLLLRPRPDPQPFFSQLPPKEAGEQTSKMDRTICQKGQGIFREQKILCQELLLRFEHQPQVSVASWWLLDTIIFNLTRHLSGRALLLFANMDPVPWAF